MVSKIEASLLVLLLIVHQSISLTVTNMTAPMIQDPRHDMHLYCKFDMGNEDLYAVKWYKDDHEFFRYAPSGPDRYVQYPVPGVTVDEKRSYCTRESCDLMLTGLHIPFSSGAYRCEVSSEAPAFRLASQTYNITVAVLPQAPPFIKGLIDNYLTRDVILANCTSDLADPKPRLTWYINEEFVAPRYTKELHYETVKDKNNGVVLRNTILQLRLPLNKEYKGKVPSSSLEVKCVSSVEGINSFIAPPLTTTKNIMVLNEDHLVKNQMLHWSKNSARINFTKFWPISILLLCYI